MQAGINITVCIGSGSDLNIQRCIIGNNSKCNNLLEFRAILDGKAHLTRHKKNDIWIGKLRRKNFEPKIPIAVKTFKDMTFVKKF